MEKLELFTDGACKGNPGLGGWGALLRYADREVEACGGEANTTNNRMELTAIIKGLELLEDRGSRLKLTVFTDSRYAMDGIKLWMYNWKKNGWKTATKKPVKNIDLWQQLDFQVSSFDIDWVWVKGHSGNSGNDRADELANRGVSEFLKT